MISNRVREPEQKPEQPAVRLCLDCQKPLPDPGMRTLCPDCAAAAEGDVPAHTD
jgi:predicted amidophosphoribosyltransferase